MMEQNGESSIDIWLEQQVSWKGEDCGKVNELLLSADDVSLPQSKSCMDTFLTPPFSLNLMLKTQDGITVGNVLRGLNILDQGLSAGCSETTFSISSTRTCARLKVGVSVNLDSRSNFYHCMCVCVCVCVACCL